MKITKMAIFEQFFSMLKSGVYDECGLNFCTWMNYLSRRLMSNACEVKAGIVKGTYKGTTTSGTKFVNLTPTYINAIFWSTG